MRWLSRSRYARPVNSVVTVAPLLFGIMALSGPVHIAHAGEKLLTGNKMAIVDGQPVFLLGLYENPQDDDKLKEAAQAGFNLVRCAPNREALDRLQTQGVKAWINLGANLDLSEKTEARKAALLKTVSAVKDHPALVVWEGPDELLWNCWYRTMGYFGGTELPQMDQAVTEMGEDQKEKREQVKERIHRCRECFGRALWQEFDATREEIWKALGKPVPRPELTMMGAVQHAHASGDGLTAGFEAVRAADPDRLLWLNHAPRNSIAAMRHHNRAVDLAGCDIYPIPGQYPIGHSDLGIAGPSAVGAYTRRMCQAAAPGKGVAMVLQGFGWADFNKRQAEWAERSSLGFGRQPGWSETRFMAYDAIVNGANAILYWGTSYIDKDGTLWKDLMRLARELDALQPALVAPSFTPEPEAVADEGYGSVDREGPKLLLKKVDSDYVLFAANEHYSAVSFTVRGLPNALEGRTLHRLSTDESHVVKDGSFHDGMYPSSVHVYATSKRFSKRAK